MTQRTKQEHVDLSRRKFLRNTTAVVGAVGAAAVAYPFLESWEPSARALAAGAPVEADISKLREGEQVVFNWRGKPIFITRRTSEMVSELKSSKLEQQLRDPFSLQSEQPEYAKNPYRSIKPEYLIVVGVCTHLSCTPLYKPERGSITPQWEGGYFCPCHGSSYDLAGRVFKDVPAPLNLPIPPHKYVSDTVILIGENEIKEV